MRRIWILPDRRQSGSLKIIEDGKISLLIDAIKLKELPYSFILGIPEEVIREKINKKKIDFLFSQISKLNNQMIFACSGLAGKDISGRHIFMTYLEIADNLTFNIEMEKDVSNLEMEDKQTMEKIIKIFNDEFQAYGNYKEMKRIFLENRNINSFASELMHSQKYKPEWMPKKKLNSFILLLIICLFLLMIGWIMFL
jgi:hypothetical protein